MKKMWLSVFLVICFANVLSAATYYVATNGDDGNSGLSSSFAWETPWKAFQTADAGDTVIFREGEYIIDRQLLVANSGEINNRITFKAAEGEKVVISSMRYKGSQLVWEQCTSNSNAFKTTFTLPDLPGNSSDHLFHHVPVCTQSGIPLYLKTPLKNVAGTELDLNGPGQWVRSVNPTSGEATVYVWLNGGLSPVVDSGLVEISGFPPASGQNIIDIYEGKDYLTFDGLIFEGGLYGVCISSSHVKLINCTVRKIYGCAIKGNCSESTNSDFDLITNNSSASDYLHIEKCDVHSYGYTGIDIVGGDNCKIINNVIHDDAATGGDRTEPTVGVMCKGRAFGCEVINNRIYNLNNNGGAVFCGGSTYGGIDVESSGCIVKHNVAYDINANCIISFQHALFSEVSKNLIYDCVVDEGIYRFIISDTSDAGKVSDYCTISNNITYNIVADNDCVIYAYDSSSINLSTFVCNHNFISSDSNYFIGIGNMLTLAQFISSGYEVDSITAAPSFWDVYKIIESNSFTLSN